ncbi:DNA translocase FtsK 4TM domain-containing protein [Moraxella nasibovis]|uniref:DNA translocase FtsK n=1 Tax=Moraxella nasibovis TaxID=2904120 RepID=UPI00240F91BA|nr:DNA translocase FtsK [Moraxella nasibovis]WFF38400.1 DNA translocase FtsK 4TM domain-containing protein [Moraxella nasibovis]
MNKLLQNDSVNQMLGQLPIVKRLFFSVIGVALLVFLFIALFSYNPADPAWSHVGSHQNITNVGGQLGAWTADILRAFFGLGAWFFVVMLSHELVRLWWVRTPVFWVLRLLAYGFLLLCLSAIFAQVGAWWSGESAVFGGMLGHELMTSLAGVLGVAMSVGFLVVIGTIVATLTFDIHWSALWRKRQQNTPDEAESEDEQADHELEEEALIISQNTPKTPVYQAHNHEGTLESFLVNSGLREDLLAKKHADAQADEHHQESWQAQEQADEWSADQALDNAKTDSHEVDGLAGAAWAVQNTPSDDMAHDVGDAGVAWSDETAGKRAEDVRYDGIDDTYSDDAYSDDTHAQTTAFAGVDLNAWQQEQALMSSERPVADVDNNQARLDDMVVQSDTKPAVSAWHDQADEQKDEQDEQAYQSAQTPVSPKLSPAHAKALPTQATSVDHLPNHMASGTARPKSHAMSTLEYRMSLSPVPTLDILDPKPEKVVTYTPQELEQLSELLEIKLQEFNIKASVISALVGPVVTRFEVDLAAGIKASRVIKVAQDLARSLSMTSLRVIPVIAGKPYIGIEVPNKKRQIVSLLELLDTPDYQDPNAGISIAIGANISGKPVIADLAKAPHMLVAGTTGSGKSVLVNSFLVSMLLKYTPEELRLVLIDPKQLELANYGDIPHLLTPVITDMTEATAALNWCVAEMERRYLLMSKLRVRNIAAFNQKVKEAEEAGEPIADLLWSASDHVSDMVPRQKPLSKIVVVADEFADMIMQLGKTAEEPIVRLAQKSRAAGIHLILATQRPVATVVTGLIKSNIPVRVALRVNSATDSRIIIEESGAENMLGHGDMMFLAPGAIETERVHGAYVKDDEVNRVTDAWRERGSPDYIDLTESYTFEGEGSGDTGAGSDDEYFDLAVSHTLDTRKVSISALQRKFSIGYNRAARIVDMMEERGIVSAPDNNGKRQILM